MNKKIIAFNWKMNPLSLMQARKLADLTQEYAKKKSNAKIIIFPPFIYFEQLIKLLKTKTTVYRQISKNLKPELGAQNTFWADKGYYTGEISPKMLKNLGVKYVIIGHSERRQILGETDEMINKKVSAALEAGLKVILCVGENLDVRKKGKKAVENFIKSQLQKDLKNIENCKLKIENLTIAYEPIWAIGAGHPDTPEDAVEMIKFIKNILVASGYTLNPKILYGGSIDGKNIKNFLQYKEIDGFLVGHASLKLKEIKNIIKICAQKN